MHGEIKMEKGEERIVYVYSLFKEYVIREIFSFRERRAENSDEIE